MSIPVRRSGRIAFAALIVIALMAALVGLRLFASAGSETDPPDRQTAPPDQEDSPSTLRIGPIDGLTTDWHRAPATTSISLGTIAWFFQPAPPDTTVIWTGADEVGRDDQGSTAVWWLVELGAHVVHVEVIPPAGEARSSQSLFNVVDVPIEQITVSPIDVWVDPVRIDEDLRQDEINEQTMGYFFGQSIAALRDLGDGQYRTSVNRRVHMSVEVDPAGFAPLMEWRVRGQPTKLGGSVTHAIDDVGLHDITVGPLFNPAQAELETYSVTITSHTSDEDIVEEGEPVVFIAETDPPGYEDEITWLSSTKYGTAEPILGEGPIFIAEFNDSWGYDPEIGPWQWLGVKADNTAFNQDQKPAPSCGDPPPHGCEFRCPDRVVVQHVGTITAGVGPGGSGNILQYGESFKYTLSPDADFYCIELREVVTTAPADNGCNCSGLLRIEEVNFSCDANAINDSIANSVAPGMTPCPCTTVSTQKLQCRKKESDDQWVTFHTNMLTWERLADGRVRVTVNPDNGQAVTATQPPPVNRCQYSVVDVMVAGGCTVALCPFQVGDLVYIPDPCNTFDDCPEVVTSTLNCPGGGTCVVTANRDGCFTTCPPEGNGEGVAGFEYLGTVTADTDHGPVEAVFYRPLE